MEPPKLVDGLDDASSTGEHTEPTEPTEFAHLADESDNNISPAPAPIDPTASLQPADESGGNTSSPADPTDTMPIPPFIPLTDEPSHNRSLSLVKTRPTPPKFQDDKSPHCIPFILEQLAQYQARNKEAGRPFFIGLNGVQGAGKTTLVEKLAKMLEEQEHLQTLILSIDDLYLTHEAQSQLAHKFPANKMLQHRGQPGTHDLPLARLLFKKLIRGEEVKIPQYDKSAYSGQGDRVPEDQWKTVNGLGEPKVQVVIFEGWCVGFSALISGKVRQRFHQPSITLQQHTLADLQLVNGYLARYDFINDTLDTFIHLDAEQTGYVYVWRRQQEAEMILKKGKGMTEEQVNKFIDGYYPAYELYTQRLRKGIFNGKFEGWQGRQLTLIIGRNREVVQAIQF